MAWCYARIRYYYFTIRCAVETRCWARARNVPPIAHTTNAVPSSEKVEASASLLLRRHSIRYEYDSRRIRVLRVRLMKPCKVCVCNAQSATHDYNYASKGRHSAHDWTRVSWWRWHSPCGSGRWPNRKVTKQYAEQIELNQFQFHGTMCAAFV